MQQKIPTGKIILAVILGIATIGTYSGLRTYWYPTVAMQLGSQQMYLDADRSVYIKLQMWQEAWNYVPWVLAALFVVFLLLLFKKNIKAAIKKSKEENA